MVWCSFGRNPGKLRRASGAAMHRHLAWLASILVVGCYPATTTNSFEVTSLPQQSTSCESPVFHPFDNLKEPYKHFSRMTNIFDQSEVLHLSSFFCYGSCSLDGLCRGFGCACENGTCVYKGLLLGN